MKKKMARVALMGSFLLGLMTPVMTMPVVAAEEVACTETNHTDLQSEDYKIDSDGNLCFRVYCAKCGFEEDDVIVKYGDYNYSDPGENSGYVYVSHKSEEPDAELQSNHQKFWWHNDYVDGSSGEDPKTGYVKATLDDANGFRTKSGSLPIQSSTNEKQTTPTVTKTSTATTTVTKKSTAAVTVKKKNTMTVSFSSKKLKASALKKKAKSFNIKVSKANGKVTYKSCSKKIQVTSKGKITVKKGTKKGTYKFTVTAAGDKTHKSIKKLIRIIVK